MSRTDVAGREINLYRAETAQQETHEDHTEFTQRAGWEPDSISTRPSRFTYQEVSTLSCGSWRPKPAWTKVECQSSPLLGDEVDGALGKENRWSI